MQGVHFPIITNGKALNNYFPHLIIPHLVWIDKEGKIRAITGHEEATGENLSLLAKGTLPSLPQKRDLLDFTASRPVLSSATNQAGVSSRYSSAFAGPVEGAQSVIGLYRDSLAQRFLCLNQPVTVLYQSLGGLPDNLILPEVKDASRLNLQPAAAWEENKLYTYELTVPLSAGIDEIHRLAKEDFDRYLHLSTGYEDRLVSCLALIKLADTLMPSRSPGREAYLHISSGDSEWVATRASGADLVTAMNNCSPAGGPVFVDSTGDRTPMDIHVTVPDIRDTAALRKALAPFGFGLVPTGRTLRVFVIRDEAPATASASAALSP